jgi:uncharacterized protein
VTASTSPPPPPAPEPLSAQPPPPPPGDDEDDDVVEADKEDTGNKGNDGFTEGKEPHDEAQVDQDPKHEEDREKAEKPPKN